MWRDGVAIITFREDGKEKTWGIGCLIGVDNERTIREHLKKCRPDAEFLSVEFQEVLRKKEKDE